MERASRVRVVNRYDAFICYSARKGVYNTFHDVFKAFLSQRQVNAYSAAKLPSGCIWESEIFEAIRKSDSAILLLSPPFFQSRFIQNKELPLLIEAAERKWRRKRLYPILVEQCSEAQLAP